MFYIPSRYLQMEHGMFLWIQQIRIQMGWNLITCILIWTV